MINIIEYKAGYTERVINLILPIQQTEFGIHVTIDDQPDLNDIPDFYQKGIGNFWMAVDDNDTVLGTIALKDIGDSSGALRKMFVHENFRGKEHGVAQRLLETLLKWAQQKNMITIFLGTTDKFLAAHRFYEKNGFELVEKHNLPESFLFMPVDTRFYKYELPRKS